MVHYAVVGGKRGRRTETPLNVMMHNREAFHVSVDVQGNRVVTSVDGQEVDSWTDDLIKSGGIGFFSEVGESARVYWMKVTKNQDWLGRVCAYLSGSTTDTAELWRDDYFVPPPGPLPALPRPNADVTLAAVFFTKTSSAPEWARTLKYERTELCRS